MKKTFASFINWLVVFVHTLLSNPQRVRTILIIVVLAIVLASVFVPSLVTLADHMGGSGN